MMVDEPPPNFFARAPKPRRKAKAPAPEVVPVQYVNGEDKLVLIMPPDCTDDAIGLRFSAEFGGVLRYVADWNRWMLWDGRVWRRDNTLRVYDLIRKTIRAIGPEAPDERVRAKLAAASTVAAIEKLVRSDRRHALAADAWDADPWLLNTPGGVVNLETGETGPHDPTYLMTKCTGVAPATVADCPRWMRFLERVTGNDPLLEAYLKRVAGYWLTGLTREHAMWFLYGTGRNGKGVFLNTITRIMGDYALTASPDTFTADGHGKHLTVLARLQGARLVVSQETEEGVPWAEARIKAVTGGDPITANFMRQDPFTYLPQFKLGMSGNHKPTLKSVDEAIRARFNLVPFLVTIPLGERDPKLPELLWEEAPGILAWMLEGCWDWRHARLRPPAIVTDATKVYFDEEDATSLWLADCCDTSDPRAKASSSLMFECWSWWAVGQGERAGTQKAFSRTMERHGFEKKREPDGVKFLCIKLAKAASPFWNHKGNEQEQ
jgi:P4 family phage/plasmid primase-like protien